jgi:choline-sulfatase
VAYYGLCTFLDRQVGALLAALTEHHLAANTIVVYCSDHGEMLGEHGLWWKSTFYDGAGRVPLILAWPGRVTGGQRRTETVSLMDVGTTLLELAGADPLPGASGRSFRARLAGARNAGVDIAFAENVEPAAKVVARMVRCGPWKYNYYHGLAPELFHLQDDPGEKDNLARKPRYRSVQRRLKELVLRDWNPERVTECIQRHRREQALIATWIKRAHPPEPDPLWFARPPRNWVDNKVGWKAEV